MIGATTTRRDTIVALAFSGGGVVAGALLYALIAVVGIAMLAPSVAMGAMGNNNG